ncbi:hypothetical protein [Nonomuraea sp. NPDC048826]|uniref:hypothetical protein n=1 Tax=Nonomuraea sp. NPDC048826 TaxID=3364347 RepID=UPI00372100AF
MGLTEALGAAFTRLGRSPLWDRGLVLVQLAVAIALGATSMRQIALLASMTHGVVVPPDRFRLMEFSS